MNFKLKIFANRNNHDYAILLQVTGDEPFIEDPRDLEAFIAQITAGRKMSVDYTVTKVMYDRGGEEEGAYDCIYIDFKKEQQKQ